MRQGQFSLEYLITYGWIFFIIMAGIAALVTFGVLNVQSLLPDRCDFFGQIACADYFVSSSQVKLVVVNQFGVDLVISGANVTDGADVTCLSADLPVTWLAGRTVQVNLSSCSGTALISGSRVELTPSVLFYRNTTCPNGIDPSCVYKSNGVLEVRVQ
jgi:hypothetical protein